MGSLSYLIQTALQMKLDAATRILNEFLHFMNQIGYTDKMVLELIINFQG
jgi:hypothetical protein